MKINPIVRDYKREEERLLMNIAWQYREIEQMEKKRAMHMSYIIHVIHPKMRKADVYVWETGEQLRDYQVLFDCKNEITALDRDIKVLDMCINNCNTYIMQWREEIEQLSVDKLRSEAKVKRDHNNAEAFFNLPKQKGIPQQMSLF